MQQWTPIRFAWASALLASVAFAACGGDAASAPAVTPAKATITEAAKAAKAAPTTTPTESNGNAPGLPNLTGELKRLPSGLAYIDEVVGAGALPRTGQTVQVHYTGWLTNGQKFDSSRDRGAPFEFPLGAGRVIQGWDVGVATMTVGSKRRLVLPGSLAYGPQGIPGVIPPNATLLFDVELLALK